MQVRYMLIKLLNSQESLEKKETTAHSKNIEEILKNSIFRQEITLVTLT